jgi:hypothetical protein
MNTFNQREKETADKRYAHMRGWADIENACYDHACELEADLGKYLQQKSLQVGLSRTLNAITLTQLKGRTLVISTHDHRTYEVTRPGANDVRDERRKTYLTRLQERQMMDEVLEWLAAL